MKRFLFVILPCAALALAACGSPGGSASDALPGHDASATDGADATSDSGPGAGDGNLWVATSGSSSCTRSASAVDFATASANGSVCATFGEAYLAAGPGDTVRVKCGDYTMQPASFLTLDYAASRDPLTANIVFVSEDGTRGCAHLPNAPWQIAGPHVEIRHFTMDQTACTDSPTVSAPPCPSITINTASPNGTSGAHDVVVDDVRSSLLTISGGVYNVTIAASEFGPSWDRHGLLHCNGSASPCTAQPHDITIRDVAFHDYFNTTACRNNIPAGCFAAHHQGCALTINNGYNLLFDRDQFFNCEDLPFYLHPYLSEIHDVTVQNSDIGRNAQPIQIFNPYSADPAGFGYWNLRFYNNTFGSSVSLLPSTLPSVCAGQGGRGGCEWRGNIGTPRCSGNGGFSDGWTVEYNASTAGYCGSGNLLGTASGTPTPCGGTAQCQHNDKTSSYGLSADGYHLDPGSPLQHLLPAALSWMPAKDIDGQSRSTTSSPGDDDGT